MRTTLEVAERTPRHELHCLTPDPLAVIAEEHALHLELCDLLEVIANNLPSAIDPALAEVALSIMQTAIPRHTRLEEEALFPLLRARCGPDDPIRSALECLEHEHERDAGVVQEISEALAAATKPGNPTNASMLGYILRGYFDGQRRHIAWEETVILPAARNMLTNQDLRSLQAWIMDSAHPICSRQSMLTLRRGRAGISICRQCPSNDQTHGQNNALEKK